MRKKVTALTCSLGFSLALLMTSAGAHAEENKSPYWQCVTFARAHSGMQIFGDAWTWWEKASGKYAEGHKPEPGAVLVFRAQGRMSRGHVAVVSQVVTERVITVTHANWSPIGGRRGQVEEDVTVVDVSDDGDWSRVKVWYDPVQGMGTTAYTTYGFIYNDTNTQPGRKSAPILVASNDSLTSALTANAAQADNRPASMKTSVMVRFPARVQGASASVGADTDTQKPVSLEAVLAHRDEVAATGKKASKASLKTAEVVDEAPTKAKAKSKKTARSDERVTSAELAEKLTGKTVKASVHKKVTAKKAVAQKTSAKVKAVKAKSASTAKAKSAKAKAH